MVIDKMPAAKGTKFQTYLAAGNIFCALKSKESFAAISELSELICKNTAGIKREFIEKLVVEREKLFPTVITPGVAIPHARIPNISSPLVAIGISPEGVDFKTGGELVKVVILILTPKDNPSLHLQILSALAKDFSDPQLLKKLCLSRSPSEVIDAFASGTTEHLPEYLTARDVMRKNDLITLTEVDTLSEAIRIFATEAVFDIPIVDEEKDIRGIISMEDILKLSLPEHLLWMDDLSPILKFQPFAELLRNEKETKLTDIMREDYVSVDVSVPAIQVAKIFLMKNSRLILVTENGKLTGTVRLQEFIRKFFWE